MQSKYFGHKKNKIKKKYRCIPKITKNNKINLWLYATPRSHPIC